MTATLRPCAHVTPELWRCLQNCIYNITKTTSLNDRIKDANHKGEHYSQQNTCAHACVYIWRRLGVYDVSKALRGNNKDQINFTTTIFRARY